jgi:hypothetical protein
MMNFIACYSLPNIVRVIKSRKVRWAGHVALVGEGMGVDRVLVRSPEGKRLLGRLRNRWEDNIKMDHRDMVLMGQTGFGWCRIGCSGRLL